MAGIAILRRSSSLGVDRKVRFLTGATAFTLCGEGTIDLVAVASPMTNPGPRAEVH